MNMTLFTLMGNAEVYEQRALESASLLLGRQQPHPLSPSIQTINQDEAENPKK